MKNRKYLLGVDPSFSTMGVALYNPENKTLQTGSGTFQQCLNWINKRCKMSEIIAFVEDPNLDKATFSMWGIMQKDIISYVKYETWRRTSGGSAKGMTEKKTLKDLQSTFSIATNYAQKVGNNKAAASMILKLLEDRRVPTVQIAPSFRDRADKPGKLGKISLGVKFLTMPTKTTQEQFYELTGCSGHTNEHARDAATMIHNRTIIWAEMMFYKNDEFVNKKLKKKDREKLLRMQV